MTTGERLRSRRKEIGLSAEKVAGLAKVSPATIYRYESGDIEKVPGDILCTLSQILRTTPAYLMGWEDDYSYQDDSLQFGFSSIKSGSDSSLCTSTFQPPSRASENRPKGVKMKSGQRRDIYSVQQDELLRLFKKLNPQAREMVIDIVKVFTRFGYDTRE